MNFVTILLLTAPIIHAQFYVKDQRFRYPADDQHCSVKKACDFELHPSGDGHDYSLNFVEVRGDGKYFDDNQITKAVTQIKDARRGGKQKPFVFIYIHGWHNNAGEVTNGHDANCLNLKGDVAKFRECGLAQVAKEYPTVSGAPPAVVGVYLGWQGTDFTPLTLVGYIVPSYTLRRYAATHVGMTGMCRAIDTMLDTVREHRDDYFVALMGHSFGARVLENAVERVDPDRNCEGLFKDHRERLKKLSLAESSAPLEKNVLSQPVAEELRAASTEEAPANMVFYVNAAASNTVTRRTIDDWNLICDEKRDNNVTKQNPVCRYDPLYLAATSRTDIDTGLVMFVANVAFLWWPTSLNPLRFEVVPLSAGNSFWMHTHHGPKIAPCNGPSSKPHGLCFQVPPDPNTKSQTYEVDPTQDFAHRFWIMNTDSHFIRNHGDVWNPRVFALIHAVMQRNDRYQCTRSFNIAQRNAPE